jgi:predicted enzyme related to lactoylglutathione lyase
MSHNHPTFGNGKICYIEIPAIDINTSSSFYKNSFKWDVRQRDDGSIGFDDAVGEVSGTWVTSRKPATEPGLLISIMVDDIEVTLELIEKYGGKVVQPVGKDFPEITALFADPAGNVMGLYQQR